MIGIKTITQQELVERIKDKLGTLQYKTGYSDFSATPLRTPQAAYVLILGAGFSYGVVPLVNELMQQTIGDYYYPNQDQWGNRDSRIQKKDSANFWKEFNSAANRINLPLIELNNEGLPKNPGTAYQILFTGKGAHALFTQNGAKKLSYLEQLSKNRLAHRQVAFERLEEKLGIGNRFVDGFLQYVLNPGAEHGRGSTGRNRLNDAHIYLAALLEAQQLGKTWNTGAFCRTILTTNFDTLLQNALQFVNLLYRITDKPEKGFDIYDFQSEEGPIHLVYVHGSILRYNPASTIDQLSELENRNFEMLRSYLESRDAIVIGYSGWKDGLMAALSKCDYSKYQLYWCDVQTSPSPHVEAFIENHTGNAVYVNLGKNGADGLMRALYENLIPERDYIDQNERYQSWNNLIWNQKS